MQVELLRGRVMVRLADTPLVNVFVSMMAAAYFRRTMMCVARSPRTSSATS